MLSLMMKDIYLLKRTLAFSVLYLIIMLFAFSGMDNASSVFVASVVAVIYMLMMSSCAMDDKSKADVMLNSLPLSRSTIVGAKYLMVLIYVLFAIAIYIVTAWVIGLLNVIPNMNRVNMEGFAEAFFASLFMPSIYLPFYFKFGYIKSRIWNFVLLFIMLIGISASDAAVGIKISSFQGTSSLSDDMAIMGAALAILAISYAISLKIYRNREF